MTESDKKKKRPSILSTITLGRKTSSNYPVSLPISPASPTEIIKLSTVNHSGIYLPPSPSDDYNANEHYFVESPTDTCFFPLDGTRLMRERKSLFTPSDLIK
ncbi:hypothetical protein BD560DRAFT_413984 [Blakeslea trispora]|nr:hypothetical protein BD560DRAFT_413984 [Blakeslea trispora]